MLLTMQLFQKLTLEKDDQLSPIRLRSTWGELTDLLSSRKPVSRVGIAPTVFDIYIYITTLHISYLEHGVECTSLQRCFPRTRGPTFGVLVNELTLLP